jgi:hypothetical protein
MIYFILTPEATIAAYNAGKTFTPADFPELNLSAVENLFTMAPNGPDFKRILFLHLAEPVAQNNKDLLAAIELIGQRPDDNGSH